MLITGYVYEDMKALPNVNVFAVGENASAVTTSTGKFAILSNSFYPQLTFSLVGYKDVTISYADFKKLGYIELEPTTKELDEVIINPTPKDDKNNKENTWLWVLGALAVVGLGFAFSNKKSVKTKV